MNSFSRTPLTQKEIVEGLSSLTNWEFSSDSISRTFSFNSFREAMSFMVRVGFEAEAIDHHPEINNVYATVRISLNTHDAGNRVTELDFELASRINKLSWI